MQNSQPRVIAIVNQKGGVGKTTSTANLAHALALAGHSVTMIDLDPQGHLGASFGIGLQHSQGIDEVLLNAATLQDCTIDVRDGLRLVPAGSGLARMEQLSQGGVKRGMRLREAMQGQFQDQDFV